MGPIQRCRRSAQPERFDYGHANHMAQSCAVGVTPYRSLLRGRCGRVFCHQSTRPPRPSWGAFPPLPLTRVLEPWG